MKSATIEMIDQQHLDIRTITMGISLRDCAHPDISVCCRKVYDKIARLSENLVRQAMRSKVSLASRSSTSASP